MINITNIYGKKPETYVERYMQALYKSAILKNVITLGTGYNTNNICIMETENILGKFAVIVTDTNVYVASAQEYPKILLSIYSENVFDRKKFREIPKIKHKSDKKIENYLNEFFASENEDEEEYETEEKSYGPSNPWDAPGMNIRDFF